MQASVVPARDGSLWDRQSEGGKKVIQVAASVQRMLDVLPTASRVGIVTMRGSMCPITRAHVEMMFEARRLLLEEKRDGDYAECLGFLTMNPDNYVQGKFQRNSEVCSFISERKELVEMSIADIPWLSLIDKEMEAIADLPRQFPTLHFEHFHVNGEDDVIRFQKWRYAGPKNRFITIGRKDSKQRLSKELETENFLIGASVGEISSTQVRLACRAQVSDLCAEECVHCSISADLALRRCQDRVALEAMVHPRVAAWLLAREGMGSL